MKALTIFVVFLCSTIQIQAQEPLSPNDGLRQLYQRYDDLNQTAQWVCPKDTQDSDPCWNGKDATVSITPVLTAEVNEDGAEKTYLVASARPSSYECHQCGPAIGVAVFVWQSNKWMLQSKNPAIGFYGSFGKAGQVDLVAVGPHQYGVMISTDYGGQGYYESTKTLMLAIAGKVTKVWSTKDRDEDMGADFDTNDRPTDHIRHHSISVINFFWVGGPEGDLNNRYYNLSVLSHRTSVRPLSHWIHQSYREDIYKFNGSEYVRISHEQVARVTHPADKVPVPHAP